MVDQWGNFRAFDFAADMAMKETGAIKPLFDLLYSLITPKAWRRLNNDIQTKIDAQPFVPYKPKGGKSWCLIIEFLMHDCSSLLWI